MHQIGVGVLGPVYRAQDTVRDQLVAVKVFKVDAPPEQAEQIADALDAIVHALPRHRGLIELIAAGVERDTAYLVMAHGDVPSLDTRLRPGVPLDAQEALTIVRTLADAIDAAHARGIVHGGLHPRDIFVDGHGGGRASGFGVATALARAGVRVPVRRPYSPPERLTSAPIEPTADRFALGAIAFELLSGRRVVGTGAEAAARLSAPVPGADPAADRSKLQTALAAMLAEQPAHRPSSAVAFAQALTLALFPHGLTHHGPVGVVSGAPGLPGGASPGAGAGAGTGPGTGAEVGTGTGTGPGTGTGTGTGPGTGAGAPGDRAGAAARDLRQPAGPGIVPAAGAGAAATADLHDAGGPSPDDLELFTRQGTLWEANPRDARPHDDAGRWDTLQTVDTSTDEDPLTLFASETHDEHAASSSTSETGEGAIAAAGLGVAGAAAAAAASRAPDRDVHAGDAEILHAKTASAAAAAAADADRADLADRPDRDDVAAADAFAARPDSILGLSSVPASSGPSPQPSPRVGEREPRGTLAPGGGEGRVRGRHGRHATADREEDGGDDRDGDDEDFDEIEGIEGEDTDTIRPLHTAPASAANRRDVDDVEEDDVEEDDDDVDDEDDDLAEESLIAARGPAVLDDDEPLAADDEEQDEPADDDEGADERLAPAAWDARVRDDERDEEGAQDEEEVTDEDEYDEVEEDPAAYADDMRGTTAGLATRRGPYASGPVSDGMAAGMAPTSTSSTNSMLASPEPADVGSSVRVVALVLAVGLAVGGAGGYLIGQRSALRSANGLEQTAEPATDADAGSASPSADGSGAAGSAGTTGAAGRGSAASRPGAGGPASSPTPSAPSASAAATPGAGTGRAGAPGAGRGATAAGATGASGVAAGPSGRATPAAEAGRAGAASGRLIITSTPARAEVAVNGVRRGVTPLTLRNLPLGSLTVRVTRSGYAPETRRVSLAASRPSDTVAFDLEPTGGRRVPASAPYAPSSDPNVTRGGSASGLGALYVVSRPMGARVTIDGRFVGTTPLMLTDVSSGSHTVQIDAPGRKAWTSTVKVAPGQRVRVAASLEEGT